MISSLDCVKVKVLQDLPSDEEHSKSMLSGFNPFGTGCLAYFWQHIQDMCIIISMDQSLIRMCHRAEGVKPQMAGACYTPKKKKKKKSSKFILGCLKLP